MATSTACADRMRRGACGDCTRVEPCRALFAILFGQAAPSQPRKGERREGRFESPKNPLLTMLNQVARAIETSARQHSKGESRNAPEAGSPARQEVRVSQARLAEAPEGSFHRAIEQRIEPMLERGPARIQDVARALGCSRQTLYRRLKQEGVTFAELLDGLRRRLGLLYVRERGMPVKEAAYRLGFSEPAAFSRAYKRWTGSSPRRMNS